MTNIRHERYYKIIIKDEKYRWKSLKDRWLIKVEFASLLEMGAALQKNVLEDRKM